YAREPLDVIGQQVLAQLLSGFGEFNRAHAAVRRIVLSHQQLLLLQPVEQSGDGGAGDTRLFCQQGGAQARRLAAKQKQQNQSAFGQAKLVQNGAGSAINAGGQRQNA